MYMNKTFASYLLFLLLVFSGFSFSSEADDFKQVIQNRDSYRTDLHHFRQSYGGSYQLPPVNFYLFGMGNRNKLIYKNGEILNAITGELLYKWSFKEEVISPQNYSVALKTLDDKYVFIMENEIGIYVKEKNKLTYLSKNPVNLPTFSGKKYQSILRVLHQELLINIVDGKPLPNYFVYKKPWYRDSAMMAMVLAKTNNLHLIKNWILGLRQPYDKNNGGYEEPDNLGQALYLISLVSNQSHPLVPVIQKELAHIERKSWFQPTRWIEGYSDFDLHPVYQTKWAKFGLASLKLADHYSIPHVKDSYATLFWWDYKNLDIKNQLILRDDNYPYLQWAANHYINKKQGLIGNQDYPLTWEAQASAANYSGINIISPAYVKLNISATHSWHVAEAFLSLIEEN